MERPYFVVVAGAGYVELVADALYTLGSTDFLRAKLHVRVSE